MQTAYLKKHYPLQFYKATLNARFKNKGKLNKYIKDALDNNIKVLPPHINKSKINFDILNEEILFGLSAISGVGDSTISPILEERSNGLFKSINDFTNRTGVSETDLITLIKSGAIPCKSKHNAIINYANKTIVGKEYKDVSTLPTLLKLQNEWGIDTDVIKDKSERLKLFNAKKKVIYDKDQVDKTNKKIELFKEKYMGNEEMWEFNTLSVFLTSNPFSEVSKSLIPFDEVDDGNDVTIVGVIADTTLKKNKLKQQFAYLTVATAFGLVEMGCWASNYAIYGDLIKKGTKIAILCGKDEDKYTVKEMKLYDTWVQDIKRLSKFKNK